MKANLRLNTKKLYTANGLAVQELLKAVTMLYQASQSAEMEVQDQDEMNENRIRSKLNEFKKSRQLTSEIASRGANLYDELSKEVMLRVRKSEHRKCYTSRCVLHCFYPLGRLFCSQHKAHFRLFPPQTGTT